jgi:FkbM family methyltransferase
MFHSQFKQDEFIYNRFFLNKNDGFFLEIGADDGIRFSNCNFFEKTMQWKGIAIEARESAFEKLVNNRTCECIQAVLSDTCESVDFMELRGYGTGLSGIVKNYDERHVKRIQREINHKNHIGKTLITVNTVLLSDILEERNIKRVDFLSIDTEGSELNILSTIDFDKVNIHVIAIEDNYNDPKLMKFFVDRGYSFVQRIECDKIFKKN